MLTHGTVVKLWHGRRLPILQDSWGILWIPEGMPGQLPQPSCGRTWTLQGGPWGQDRVRCAGSPAPFIPQSQPTAGKPAGTWLCSHCCLHGPLLSSNPLPGRSPSKTGSAGDTWGGLALEWSGLWLWIPHSACPQQLSWLTPRALQLPVPLPCISPTYPTASPAPTPKPPGSQKLGNIPCSALQRADNDMLTCSFVPLLHSVEM